MMIGGIDLEFAAPNSEVVFDGIITVCRRRWPRGVFLDADESQTFALRSRAFAWRKPSQEFFVFSDQETAENWEELGPCAANWNRMLHFLRKPNGENTSSITVVVDELTPDIQTFLDDLQATFRDAFYFDHHTVAA